MLNMHDLHVQQKHREPIERTVFNLQRAEQTV